MCNLAIIIQKLYSKREIKILKDSRRLYQSLCLYTSAVVEVPLVSEGNTEALPLFGDLARHKPKQMQRSTEAFRLLLLLFSGTTTHVSKWKYSPWWVESLLWESQRRESERDCTPENCDNSHNWRAYPFTTGCWPPDDIAIVNQNTGDYRTINSYLNAHYIL